MRERMTNVILGLFVQQAGEPQDDDARKRLQRANDVLQTGLADEARAAEAATAKELKYAEKLKRRAERLAGGPPAPGAAACDSESELPEVFITGKTRSKKKPATEDAAVAADDAAADVEAGEQRRSSGRTRRAARAAAIEDEDLAPAHSDSDFQPDKPEREKREKPKQRKRYRLASDMYDDDEQEPLEGIVVRKSTRAKARDDAEPAAASADPPADANDVDADDDDGGAPGFVPVAKSPSIDDGGPPGFLPASLESAGARGSSPPPASDEAAAGGWGHPVPIVSPPPPPPFEFAMVPSLPEDHVAKPPEQQPLKAPPPAERRRRDKSAPDAVERPAAPAQEVIMVSDDEVADNPNGTQSL